MDCPRRMPMHYRPGRAAAACAGVLAVVFSGLGEAKEKDVVIEFPSRERCVVFGEEIAAGALGARLAKAQEKSPAFDTMNFRIVMAAGMSQEDYDAIERETRDVIRSLGAGNKVVAERRAPLVVRVLTSLWFWVLTVVGVGAGVFLKKKREADNAWRKSSPGPERG